MNTANLKRELTAEIAEALLPVLRSDCQAWRAMEAEGWRDGLHRLDVLSLGLVWKTIPIKTLRHVTAEAQSTPTSSRNSLASNQVASTPEVFGQYFLEAEEGT